jgi:hypothetical protein
VPFIDTSALEVIERLPGWYGRYFHSPSMTFAITTLNVVRRSTSIYTLRKKSTRSSKGNLN